MWRRIQAVRWTVHNLSIISVTDIDDPSRLDFDAPSYAIGAVLSQGD